MGQFIFESFLSSRQFQKLQQKKPPKTLEGEVSQEVFDKSQVSLLASTVIQMQHTDRYALQAYGRAKAKFGFVSSIISQAENLVFIYRDILPKLWGLTGLWMARYLPEHFSGEITHSLMFLFTFNLVTTILSMPRSYYSNFVIEETYGFNKQTVKIWLTDMVKSQALMIALGGPLLSAFLAIIQKTGNTFFYYLWLFSAAVQVFAITIYPILILPMFNKLSPLEPGALKTGVEGLAKRLKFPLNELYVIDGSKRSAHSNAYFYGLPWKKHIVIYDTLIEKSETEEVVAVLSHELGHWSLGHTTKLFGIAQVCSPDILLLATS